jgi:hypothetical protein
MLDKLDSPDKPGSSDKPVATKDSTLTPLYDAFIQLDPEQQEDILKPIYKMREKDALIAIVNRVIDSRDTNDISDKKNIDNILSKYNLMPKKGGRRRRKTIKKHCKLTKKRRKLYKGGYVYSSSKELDKSSSVISNSSNKMSSSYVPSKSKSTKEYISKNRRATKKHKSNK